MNAMKLSRLAVAFVTASFALLILAGSASATQYTTTCSNGQWDMLSLMFMQQSYLSQNYYVYGTHTPGNSTVYHNDVVDITTQHSGIWDTGKINSVKDFQAEPDGTDSNGQPKYYPVPPYWGYPWDINLFDDNYVYLWITENAWGDAYSYKAFNNGSSNNSMLFTRRCVAPGDNGSTSQLVNNEPGNGSNTTQFYIVPESTLTYTSGDCSTSKVDNLGYAIMNVLSPESNAFTLTDTIHGGNISLTLVPVTYRYNCTSSTGGCSSKEEFDFGKDSSNNIYGLVQWTLYSSTNGGTTWTQQEQSKFNQLKQWTSTQISQGMGGTTVSFPCNPI
jgi:hypothetical protein